MKRTKQILLFGLILLTASLSRASLAKAATSNSNASQTFSSNCIVTKIGNPGSPPALPAGCANSSGISVSQLGPESINHPGYFRIESSPDGSYVFEAPACTGKHFGSPLLINIIYTVAKNWKLKYPQGHLNIGDLNGSGHASHKWGRGFDMDATTNGRDWVADFTKGAGTYNRQATVELGQMFADTDKALNIWYMDQAVNSAVLDYTKQTGHSKGLTMKSLKNHDNHFHVDIDLSPLLSVWEPGC